ncbi:MAG TPA: PspC domain-containing protein [Gemmatimonadaceae bacterium]|nr:PspC domain-containing protein [Gemmatimonadaceae bacterium]
MHEDPDRRPVVSQRGSVQPRLWRSRDNRVFAGVVGGLAERLNVNPTMLRWFSAFATVMTGFVPAIVLYLIVWAITSPYPSNAPPR